MEMATKLWGVTATSLFKVGDQIRVGKYTATCQKVLVSPTNGSVSGYVFWLDQYLDRQYTYVDAVERMPQDCMRDGNFKELVDFMPLDIYLPSTEDIYGKDDFYRDGYKYEDGEQWELMKVNRNRLPDQVLDLDTKYLGCWLYNEAMISGSHAVISYAGDPSFAGDKTLLPVRPAMILSLGEEARHE